MLIYLDTPKLQELLSRVQKSTHSDFYRKKYADVHKDVWSNPEKAIAALPFLTRQDITLTPPAKRLYVPRDEVSFIAYTSGTTTGAPLVLYWSEVQNYYLEPSLDTEARTLLITHPALNKNFGHTFIQQCRQAKIRVLPVFADYQNLAQSAILARETGADAIYATPTIAIMLANHIDEHYDAKRIKLIVVFSENLTKLKRLELNSRFPNALIANTYGSTEIGQLLFYPCRRIMEEGSNDFHIITEALVAVELDDGELILTQQQNKAFPLIRYRTGDFFESVNRVCECGIGTPLLSWSGRTDVDKIRVSGIELRAEDVESSLRFCTTDIGNDYQLHFYSESSTKTSSEVIRIVVEVVSRENKLKNSDAQKRIAEKVRGELLSRLVISQNSTLQTAVDRGLFLAPEVFFVDELSVKTTKIRRLVNHIS